MDCRTSRFKNEGIIFSILTSNCKRKPVVYNLCDTENNKNPHFLKTRNESGDVRKKENFLPNSYLELASLFLRFYLIQFRIWSNLRCSLFLRFQFIQSFFYITYFLFKRFNIVVQVLFFIFWGWIVKKRMLWC